MVIFLKSCFVTKLKLCYYDTACNAAMQHCTQYHLYMAVSWENAFCQVQQNTSR
jgi:hypothetical protein